VKVNTSCGTAFSTNQYSELEATPNAGTLFKETELHRIREVLRYKE